MEFEDLALIIFVIAMVFLVSEDIEYMTASDSSASRASWTQEGGLVHRAGFSPRQDTK